MIATDGQNRGDSSEEEEARADGKSESELSELDSTDNESISSAEEDEEHLENADEFKILRSHPSLTPTPPTDDELPIFSAETVSLEAQSENNFPRQTVAQGSQQELLESRARADNCLEESGPALIIVRGIDETDEDPCQHFGQASFSGTVGEKRILKKNIDEYNPDSEYLSDPDFHDERPVKVTIKLKLEKKQEQSGDSERLRDRFQRQPKLAERDSSDSDTTEEGSVEEKNDCAPVGKRSIDEVLESDEELVSKSIGPREVDISDFQAEEVNEEEDEDQKDEDQEDEDEEEDEVDQVEDNLTCEDGDDEIDEDDSDVEQSNRSERSVIASTFDLPIGPNPCGGEVKVAGTRNLEQVAQQEIGFDLEDSDAEPDSLRDETKQIVCMENRQVHSIYSIKSTSVEESIENHLASENQIENSLENQVTASEARPELFVDESTLAEDLMSFRSKSSIARKSTASNESEIVKLDRSYNHEQEETDSTRANDLTTEEITPVSNCKTPGTLDVLNHRLNCKQESLDDVEPEILDDTNYIPEPDEVLMSRNEQFQSRQLTDDRGLIECGAQSKDKKLSMDAIDTYCDTLASLITKEALIQAVLIEERATTLTELSLSEALESASSYSLQSTENNPQCPEQECEDATSEINYRESMRNRRKIYTSSMYYNDQLDSFPTIEQQVEQSRQIAKQLEIGLLPADEERTRAEHLRNEPGISTVGAADYLNQSEDTSSSISERPSRSKHKQRAHQTEKASYMFGRRRERADRFTLESSIDDDEPMSPIADSSKCSLPPVCHNQVLPGYGRLQRRRASLEPSSFTCNDELILNRDENPKKMRGRGARRSSYCEHFPSANENEPAALTDTEYEAPHVRRRAQPTRATTTPFRERTSRHVEVNDRCSDRSANGADNSADIKQQASPIASQTTSLKPFLDSSTLKDIERLRHWTPYEEFNEHNSVSPEICLKLVQDLKSKSPQRDAHSNDQSSMSQDGEINSYGVQRAASVPVRSKGAKLFEQRQLQSSDWIVEDRKCPTEVDGPTETDERPALDDGLRRDIDCTSGAVAQDLNTCHHARASLAEEALLITDEGNLAQVAVELVPAVVMSYSQPQLEMATMTRTPSFSASSWRVIECDSPDLLTSHDDETNGSDEMDDENEDEGDGEESTLDEGDIAFEKLKACDRIGYINTSAGRLHLDKCHGQDGSDSSNSKELLSQVEGSGEGLNFTTDRIEFAGPSTVCVAGSHTATLVDVERQGDTELVSLNPITATTRTRPLSHAGETHQATLVEWRSQVMTPIRMMPPAGAYESPAETEAASGNWSIRGYERDPPASIKNYSGEPASNDHRRRCWSLTHDYGFSNHSDDNLLQQQAESQRSSESPRLSVTSLRDSYQNLVNETVQASSQNRYRSYHYSFGMNQTRPRASSMQRSSNFMQGAFSADSRRGIRSTASDRGTGGFRSANDPAMAALDRELANLSRQMASSQQRDDLRQLAANEERVDTIMAECQRNRKRGTCSLRSARMCYATTDSENCTAGGHLSHDDSAQSRTHLFERSWSREPMDTGCGSSLSRHYHCYSTNTDDFDGESDGFVPMANSYARVCDDCRRVRQSTQPFRSCISTCGRLASDIGSLQPSPNLNQEQRRGRYFEPSIYTGNSLGVVGSATHFCRAHNQTRQPEALAQEITRKERYEMHVCIKLPHRLHEIIICRIPEVKFATVMQQQEVE